VWAGDGHHQSAEQHNAFRSGARKSKPAEEAKPPASALRRSEVGLAVLEVKVAPPMGISVIVAYGNGKGMHHCGKGILKCQHRRGP